MRAENTEPVSGKMVNSTGQLLVYAECLENGLVIPGWIHPKQAGQYSGARFFVFGLEDISWHIVEDIRGWPGTSIPYHIWWFSDQTIRHMVCHARIMVTELLRELEREFVAKTSG